jgi:putative membrane protein
MLDGHSLGFGGAFMWLFWILLIIVIAWALKAILAGNSKASMTEKAPLEILEDRLARGEIDEQEFERKRNLLKQ